MPDDELTTKEKIDALIEISKLHRQRFDARRSYEWKVNLALWPALAVVVAAIAVGKCDQVLNRLTLLSGLGVLICIFLVYTFVWTRGLSARNAEDRRKAWAFSHEAERLAWPADSDSELPAGPGKESQGGFDWSQWSQVAITLLFILLIVIAAVGRTSATTGSSGQTLTVSYTTTQPSKHISGTINNE